MYFNLYITQKFVIMVLEDILDILSIWEKLYFGGVCGTSLIHIK